MFKSIKLTHIIALVAIGVSRVIIISFSYLLSIFVISYLFSLIPYLLFLYPIYRVSKTNIARQNYGVESHTLACNAQ